MASSTSGNSILRSIKGWFATPNYGEQTDAEKMRVDWVRAFPFVIMHLMCLAVFYVGFSWVAFGVATFNYCLHVFVLTGFYHRYFSHRAFKTSRFWQFVFGAIGCTSVQRGPLWWAAHHRHHHAHSDDGEDLHSPRQHGFWYSHMGWFLTARGYQLDWKRVPDFAKYPEMRFLEKCDLILAVLWALANYTLGAVLEAYYPGLGTTGFQMLIWGFFCSTVAVYHVTYFVNSLTHVMGSKRFRTKDDSRNNWLVAILTFGEGWHNNHHHYPASASQGFYWWEVDMSFYILKFLSMMGVVWDLKKVPSWVLERQLMSQPVETAPAKAVPSCESPS